MGYISLKESYDKTVNDDLPEFLIKIQNSKLLQDRVRPQAWHLHEKIGLYKTLNESIIEARQAFFICGLTDIYKVNKLDNHTFIKAGIGVNHASYACMSNNSELISHYARLGDHLNLPHRKKGQIFYAMQCIMKNDDKDLAHQVGLIKKIHLSNKKDQVWAPLHIQFFEGILNQDKDAIFKAITEMESKKWRAKNPNKGLFINTYMSFPSVGYAKLAWLRGLEIEIDSPTLPMQLMPIVENEEYPIEYNFLKGLLTDKIESSKLGGQSFEEIGPYPTQNPSLRSKFVSEETVEKIIRKFLPNFNESETSNLISLIWNAYTDPQSFDLNHQSYVRQNASWEITSSNGHKVKEARPFWSEYKEHNDQSFFEYCCTFILNTEGNIEIDDSDTFLASLKT